MNKPFAAALRLMYRDHAATWSQPRVDWADRSPGSTLAAIHRAYFYRLDHGMIPGLVRRNGKVYRT